MDWRSSRGGRGRRGRADRVELDPEKTAAERREAAMRVAVLEKDLSR